MINNVPKKPKEILNIVVKFRKPKGTKVEIKYNKIKTLRFQLAFIDEVEFGSVTVIWIKKITVGCEITTWDKIVCYSPCAANGSAVVSLSAVPKHVKTLIDLPVSLKPNVHFTNQTNKILSFTCAKSKIKRRPSSYSSH